MEFNKLATKESIDKTIAALLPNGIEAILVETGKEAMEKIKELIPQGASVNNGASRTLEQIGYIDYLKDGKHGWNNLKDGILAEKDPDKVKRLRKEATMSDYFLSSVNALTENGEFVNGSNTGSQLPSIAYNSPYLIFVVSTKKIVPDLMTALERIEKYVVPLENENMMQKFKMGTYLSKLLISRRESPFNDRKVTMILVNEILGF
jgi:hypothetical protein